MDTNRTSYTYYEDYFEIDYWEIRRIYQIAQKIKWKVNISVCWLDRTVIGTATQLYQ